MARINNNVTALNAFRQLSRADLGFSKSIERLSSGFRINRAGDDPAGLVLSEKLRAQITGIEQAVKNTQDAVSLIQTAEGALDEIHRLLNEIRALTLHSANTGVVDTETIAADQAQVDQAIDSLNRIALNTVFAGKKLLDGTAGNQATITDATNVAQVSIGGNAPSSASFVNLEVTQVASQAYVSGTKDIASGVAANGSITINGVSVSLTTTQSGVDAVAAINSALTTAGVDITASINSSGAASSIRLTAGAFGDSFSITLTDTNGLIAASGSTVDAGQDIAGNFDIGGTNYAAQGDGLVLTGTTGILKDLKATVTTAGNAVATRSNAIYITPGQLTFQVGSEGTDTVKASIGNVQATKLGTTAGGATGLNSIKTGGTYALATNATTALTVVDEAISDISTERSKLGSIQSFVLETQVQTLNVALENVVASESQIRDVNVAQETTNFTKFQILLQASTAVLAQANAAPQTVLQLLQ